RELEAKKYDEALRDLRAGRAELPQAAGIPYDEGLAHFGRGSPDSAVARLQEAMKLRGDPARAAAAYNLGNLAMRGKDYRRAAGGGTGGRKRTREAGIGTGRRIASATFLVSALLALGTLLALPRVGACGTSPGGKLSIDATLDVNTVAPGATATLTVQVRSAG